jgi:hypothetical protein
VKDKPTLPMTCISCHQTDDRHDGSFGRQCEKCHVTANWRQILRQRSQREQGAAAWSWLWPDGTLHRRAAREANAS